MTPRPRSRLPSVVDGDYREVLNSEESRTNGRRGCRR